MPKEQKSAHHVNSIVRHPLLAEIMNYFLSIDYKSSQGHSSVSLKTTNVSHNSRSQMSDDIVALVHM